MLLAMALAIGFARFGVAAEFQETPAERREDPLERELVVPLHGGRLDLAELGRALLDGYGLDADAIALPSRVIDVRGMRGYLLLTASRKALLDTVRFHRSIDEDRLSITIDRVRARELRRGLRARLASMLGGLSGNDLLARHYELAMPAALDASRPLVVLVHGVESGPTAWSELRALLERQSPAAQVATFAYPNDDACERIAARFARELRALGDTQRVRVVGYSMGGLIARAAIEDPKLDPQNVEMLILIGTPNRGSRLGGFRFGLEAAQFVQDGVGGPQRFGKALLEGLHEHLEDGLGEAGGDLLPGSVFLTRLSQFPRNPRVRYHLVLGTRSVLTEAQLAAVRAGAKSQLDGHRATRLLEPKLTSWLMDLDELVDGRGDGAVSVARGELDGVEPVLVARDHVGLIRERGLLGEAAGPDAHPVFTRVLAWLMAPSK